MNRKNTWLILILVSTLFMLWSSIPNLRGYTLQDEERSYGGAFFDVRDYSVHIAMIRAGMNGDWAYSLRFTTEAHQPQVIRMFYVVLGQINRLFHADPELMYQIARWICGYLALFALFLLLQRIFIVPSLHWSAFFLAVFGSGAGYYQLMVGLVPGVEPPVDLWLIDAYMFFSLTIFPHFAFTLALMCVAILAFFDYLESKRPAAILIIIGAALAVQFVNPIIFVLLDIVMVTAALVLWSRNRRIDKDQFIALAVIALAQTPLLIYNILILTYNPLWEQYTIQNKTLSPAPFYYLMGFLFFWPLVIAGSVKAVKERNHTMLAMLAWCTAAFLLAYAPFAIQRRFLLGITIPLSLLSIYGLAAGFEKLIEKAGWIREKFMLVAVPALLLISTSSLLFIPSYLLYLQSHPPEYFYPRSLDGAFVWINSNTGQNDIVLGMEDTGRLVAQKTGRRVFLGHPMETLNYTIKSDEVAAYYHGETAPDWAARASIQWVIYGPYEHEIAPDFSPGTSLLLVYENKVVRIYRVR